MCRRRERGRPEHRKIHHATDTSTHTHSTQDRRTAALPMAIPVEQDRESAAAQCRLKLGAAKAVAKAAAQRKEDVVAALDGCWTELKSVSRGGRQRRAREGGVEEGKAALRTGPGG